MKISNSRKKTKILLLVLFAIIIASYSIYQSRNLILGPRLEIISPENGALVTTPSVIIEGRAKNISFITLNGNQIFVDEEGYFKEKLIAHPGYNIMKVASKDRFGREREQTLEFYKEKITEIDMFENQIIDNDEDGLEEEGRIIEESMLEIL